MNHSVYAEILTAMGWFDTGMDKPWPFLGPACQMYPMCKEGDITARTQVAYYPGCFAEFHSGHMAVIRETVEAMKMITDDYRVIIAPANSDYTMSKYGDVIQASNKYRYDKIADWLRGAEGMERVHIDLNPMLAYDRDHNFPDLIDGFLRGHGLTLHMMHRAPYVVCGKDRDWSALLRATNRLRVFYFKGDQTSSSEIMKGTAQNRVKKYLVLRCDRPDQYELFKSFFRDEYADIQPWYRDREIHAVRQLCLKQKFDFTICKEYQNLLPYHKLSRRWINPLEQSAEFDNPDGVDFEGKLILDSDVFSGSTRRYVESRGGKLVAVCEMRPNYTELIDYNDFIREPLQYPYHDVAWRCSMAPFTRETHERFSAFIKHPGNIW